MHGYSVRCSNSRLQCRPSHNRSLLSVPLGPKAIIIKRNSRDQHALLPIGIEIMKGQLITDVCDHASMCTYKCRLVPRPLPRREGPGDEASIVRLVNQV